MVNFILAISILNLQRLGLQFQPLAMIGNDFSRAEYVPMNLMLHRSFLSIDSVENLQVGLVHQN